MNYEINIRLDRAYMGESYDQGRRYGSKWFLGEKIIGTTLIILGIAMYRYAQGETPLPFLLVAIGVFELLSNRIKKFFWLRRHTHSKLNGSEIQITLSDSGIVSKGPHSTSDMTWAGVEKVLRTPKGILVWPQKGMYWYLPERIAGTDAIEFIHNKAAKRERID